MRLEHHLVGGYVRYISPHIIIIIIIIIIIKTGEGGRFFFFFFLIFWACTSKVNHIIRSAVPLVLAAFISELGTMFRTRN